jgi:hypothetical protein
MYAGCQAINQTPGVTPGTGLDVPETATTVRVEDGKARLTDGPFVDIKEAIGGFLFYEADDLDAAIELAARIPAARLAARWRCARPSGGDDRRAGLPGPVGPGARGDGRLLRRLGQDDNARDAYRRALELVHDDAERRHLARRLRTLGR